MARRAHSNVVGGWPARLPMTCKGQANPVMGVRGAFQDPTGGRLARQPVHCGDRQPGKIGDLGE